GSEVQEDACAAAAFGGPIAGDSPHHATAATPIHPSATPVRRAPNTLPFHLQTEHLVPSRNTTTHGALLGTMLDPWCTPTRHGELVDSRSLVDTCESWFICISHPYY
ncbi:unnamed protein product, partial [Urochloa humidicola]